MSIRCVAWALEQRVGDQAGKLVLLALADEASDPGIARPGRKRIAWKAELSVSTVKRALAYLEEKGLIKVHNRGRRPDGLHLTNVYQLTIGAPPDLELERFEPRVASDEASRGRVGCGVNLTLHLQEAAEGVGDGVTAMNRGRVTAMNRGRVAAMNRGRVAAVDHVPSCPNGLRQEGAPPADAGARERLELVKAALLKACGMSLDRLTRSAKRALGLAAKEIVEAGGQPADVMAAARRWSTRFPGATMTPKGISHQWAALHAGPVQTAPPRDEAALVESDARGRAESTLRLMGHPEDLQRGARESWVDFAARCDEAFKALSAKRRAS